MDNTPEPRIDHVAIEAEMSASYIDYSMSVIAGRALPDARDGLKPVHRRILYAMRELGNTASAAYKKSARVVGDVIGKYHPHGDTAVYDAIVRMAQDFSMRYPLVDGQGNFGSRDGDAPAAMRYTEVRMQRLAEELLADIDKETVEFGPNYDESLTQPLVLPSAIPNLLLNGSTGIAVGMATNIPPHNMHEIVNATIHVIDHPDATVGDLMQIVQGPDFPTHGVICGMQPIQEMYLTGKGQLRVRGRARIDEDDAGRATIIVTELPYTVNKARLIETMAELVQNKVIEGIADIRDESNQKEPVRIVIDLRKGTLPDIVLNNLFKHTQLETTFGAIMLALIDGRPRLLNLKELLECFVRHRFEVVTRRTRFDLAKAEARDHIVQGLLKALDILDELVRTIRAARNRDEAHAALLERFGFSDAQAKAILDMRLYQLTGLEREKVEAEHRELVQTIAYLRDLLEHDAKLYGVIKAELCAVRDRYGDDRRTEIVPAQDDVAIEDLIADEPCVITISHAGYIKRVPTDAYRAQRRGGRGVAGMATKDEDYVERLFTANTHDSILFFTRGGRVYVEKVYQIPEAPRASRGKAIVNLLSLREDEKIAAMLKVRDLAPDQSVVMATEQGVVKKTNLAAFANVRRDGIIAINIDPDDQLIDVRLTGGDQDVMLTTEQGMSIRFSESQAREMGRATRGVRGIKLRAGDRVKSLAIVEDDATFLVCTANGYGKRTRFDEWRVANRGGVGIIAIRTSERNGLVVSARTVRDTECLMLITTQGMMIKMPVSDIGVIGRATQGVRLINLEEGDALISATTVAPDEEDEAGGDEPGAAD